MFRSRLGYEQSKLRAVGWEEQMMTPEQKDEAGKLMLMIMRAVKEVMSSGSTQTLHFADAEIRIKKIKLRKARATAEVQ